MLKGRVIYLCLFVFFSVKLSAQVNLQTGSSTFSIPIFNWQDDKSRLNAIVALSYNSGSGLKVSDIPSSTGQGWDLIAGGAIIRMQAGEPDDQYQRDGNEWDVKKYPHGILYATVPASQGCPTALTKYPIYGWKNQLYNQHNVIAEDRELDYFSFQFNGKAGMFVVDPTDIGKCKSLGDTKMKISFQQDPGLIGQGIRTRITSFTIQDVDGLIYKFAKHSLTKILKSEYCDAQLTQYQRQPKFSSNKIYHQAGFDNGQIENPWVINGWYLTEIEDALTHRKVYFNYSTRNINSNGGEDIFFNTTKNYPIIFHKKSITQSPALTSVTYPDGHSTTLNYGSARLDLTGDYALASIDINYQGRYLSKHELTTSYFIQNRYGTPISDYQKRVSRLCLLSVRKIGPDLLEDTPPYKFDYYTGSNAAGDVVPAPFSFAKDIWGFYNGDNSKGFNYENIPLSGTLADFSGTSLFNNVNVSILKGLCYRRNNVSGIYLNPKTGYAKNGLLRQIIYPTGGTLTYEYEQNTGILGSVNREVGGVHVSKTSSTDGGYSNGCSNPIETNYNYVVNGTGSNSSLWGLEMPENERITSNHYNPERKSYKWKLSCFPLGCCIWHFQYPGIESMQQFTDLTGFQKAMATLSPVLSIVSMISTIQNIVTAFSGGSPVALIIDVILGIVQFALTCFGNQSRDSTVTMHYSSNLNDAAPLPTQFKRVEVTESPGGVGKTVQEFTSDVDYAIWEPTNPAFSSKQRFAPWAYGLPKSTTVYDVNGNKIKETTNAYNFENARLIHNWCSGEGHAPCNPPRPPAVYSNLVSCKCLVTKSSSQRSDNWSDPAQYAASGSYTNTNIPDMQVDFYGMFTGRAELDSTEEKQYKPGSNSDVLITKTKYTYDPNIYEVSSVNTINSNGDKLSKHILYNSSLYGGVFDILTQNNILTIPVVTTSLKIPLGSSAYNYPIGNLNYYFSLAWSNAWYVSSEKVTEFLNLPNGDIRPSRVIEQRFDKPIDGISNLPPYNFQRYSGPSTTNYSKYKVIQEFGYNSSSNLTGVKDEGGRTISNIYDYDDKYVVASVINADAVNDKKAYTSFETSATGGWTLGGAAAYSTSASVTGTRSFILSAGKSFYSTLNTGKQHVVSFWATTGTISLSGGASLLKSAPTINGFTYYEYLIAQGTGSITVSGTGTIDELRLFPEAARMRTVTYDLVIGKTSECDENNRITYYEYDKLGRLKFIKDEKRNVVKMYEYNNVSAAKQNGCPGIYYNKLISEIFSRNNCGTGYVGGDVTYSVPANTFTSALSQQDADAQAEAYLLANGQAYAKTHGACYPLYYNTAQSQNFSTESCGPGEVGGAVTYTVPAGRYSSLVSQADANQMALDEIEANGEAYANTPPNAVCITSYVPLWSWLEGAAYYCQTVNGESHLFIQETDINPNSSTYNQTRWSDVGPSELCSTISYFNTIQSQTFTRNNCTGCTTGSQVTYTVPANTFGSSVSVAAANQIALANIAANGQNYANANGTCMSGSSIPIIYNNTAGVSGYKAKYTNTSTNSVYIFDIPTSGTGIIGCVPSGTYSLIIYKTPHGFAPLLLFGNGCQYVSGGYSGSFSNVDVGYCYYATIEPDL